MTLSMWAYLICCILLGVILGLIVRKHCPNDIIVTDSLGVPCRMIRVKARYRNTRCEKVGGNIVWDEMPIAELEKWIIENKKELVVKIKTDKYDETKILFSGDNKEIDVFVCKLCTKWSEWFNFTTIC